MTQSLSDETLAILNRQKQELYDAIKDSKTDKALELISKLNLVELEKTIYAIDKEEEKEKETTFISEAALYSNFAIVKALLDRGVPAGLASGKKIITALHKAEDPAVMDLLIARGADINAKDHKGRTPLNYADTAEVADLLIARGADINAKDHQGETPLHLSVNYEVTRSLIRNGADVNAKDHEEYTPAHCFAFHGRLKCLAELLKDQRVEIDARNEDGETPLYLAVEQYGNLQYTTVEDEAPFKIINLLIENGADINAASMKHVTILDVAHRERDYRKIDYSKVIELLKEKGAKTLDQILDEQQPELKLEDTTVEPPLKRRKLDAGEETTR